jgi:ribosome-associated translation inhibitor RaiA
MRITTHAEGFALTPPLRAALESRLFDVLRSLHDRIRSVAVRLQTRVGRNQPDTISCEIVVNLHPSGQVRARADEQQMLVSVDRVARAIRATVEHLRSHAAPLPEARRAADSPGGALQMVLDDNRISQLQREMLERPENYLRSVGVREYWSPPVADDDASAASAPAFVGAQ